MKAAFIGLGIMGAPIARNMLKAGIELLVNDISKEAVEKVVSYGGVFAEYEEIGQCDVIFMILPNGKISRSVLFDAGLADKTKEGALICDLSSQSPGEATDTAQKLASRGIRYVDAPVSGGETKAISGELSIMVGGDKKDFDQLSLYFLSFGKKISLMGRVGTGNAAKLANQIITNVTIGAIAEAVNLAEKAGIEPKKLFDAIRDGAAGSAMMNTRAEKIVARDYKPGAKISINKKDMGNVIAFAESQNLSLPLAESYFETLRRLSEMGLDDLDVSAVPEYYTRQK